LRDLRAALGRIASEPELPSTVTSHHDGASAAPPIAPAPKLANGQGTPPKVGRYLDFVRKFSEGLHSIEAAAVRPHDRPPDGFTAAPEGLIILDMEVDLRPVAPHPESTEEILFIE